MVRDSDRHDAYRLQVRRTFQAMSDEALRFQDARVSLNPCIDREELDREIAARAQLRRVAAYGIGGQS